MKWFTAGLLLAAVIMVGVVGAAQAQGNDPPAPVGITAANGPNPGEVNLSWNGVDGAVYYRIGWIAFEDYEAVPEGQDWLEAFAFVDVANQGQTSHTITRLTPGIPYAFIVASNGSRYGEPQWSEWATLKLNDDGTACPTVEPEPAPEPTPTPTPTRAPVANGDYDSDDDGLIEVANLAQLNAMRYDSDGDGYVQTYVISDYIAAFPGAADDMGCPTDGCIGYELVNNLDFDTNGNGKADEGDAYWNDGGGWDPIEGTQWGRSATFDGNGYTVSNLYINRPDDSYIGLFGVNNGTIRNVSILGVDATGNFQVGGLIGVNRSSGAIVGSSASGAVTGNNNLGGLVGRNEGDIIDSSANVAVTGNDKLGGLVGANDAWATVNGSTTSGNVTGNDSVGGLAGMNAGTIGSSTASGAITGRYNVGGLVGLNDGRFSWEPGLIESSNASGNVTGVRYLEELVGRNIDGTISNSQGTGTVTQSN